MGRWAHRLGRGRLHVRYPLRACHPSAPSALVAVQVLVRTSDLPGAGTVRVAVYERVVCQRVYVLGACLCADAVAARELLGTPLLRPRRTPM